MTSHEAAPRIQTLCMYQFIPKSSKKGQNNFMKSLFFIHIFILFNSILIIHFSNIYSINHFTLHTKNGQVTGHLWYFKDDLSILWSKSGVSRTFILFEGQQIFVSYIYIYIPNIRESGGLKVSKLN